MTTTIAKGAVGESGSTSIITHTVTGTRQAILALRTADSSLCPNTRATYAIFLDRGQGAGMQPERQGLLLEKLLITLAVNPGDKIVVLIATIPLMNGVTCVTLGDFPFEVDLYP